MFSQDFYVKVWSKDFEFWNLIKICVLCFGKQNSTFGSVVPLAMFSRTNTFNIRMRLTVEVEGEIVEHSPAWLLKRSNVEEKSFNFFVPSYFEMGLLSSFCTQ